MGFTKITDADLIDKGVIGLPDQPGLSTAAMQAKLEETARGVIIPKHNELIDELHDTTAAGNVGATPPPGLIGTTVQSLINELAAGAGSSVKDAYKNIEAGGTTITASGEDTFKINAGSNVTITPLASPDKGIQISATGGGSSTGDMLMADYDNDGTVKTAGGIKPYVASAISGKSNVGHTHTKSEITDFPTIPTALSDLSDDSTHRVVTDTEKTSWNGKSTVSWNQQITTGQQIATVTIDGTSVNVFAPTGGGGGGGNVDSVNGKQGTVILDLGDMDDVTFTGVAQNDAIVRNGSNEWVNIPLPLSALTGSYSDLTGQPTIPIVTDTYDGTSSNGMSGKAVKSAIDALDVTVSGAGAGKTLASLTETDGKIAATFQNISITKSQISDFPTIPTVNNATLTIQQNGTNVQTFTANQSTNATANIVTDDWVKTGTVSSGSVSFTGVDDSGNYGYKVFIEVTASSTNKNPSAQISSISGTGTSSMSVTYTTDADNGATAKLRRIK